MIRFSIILICIFPSVFCLSQNPILSEVVMNIVEELSANEADPNGASLYMERLYELAEDPVLINSSNENEIARLFFLSDFQVKAITDYIKTSGKIVSLFELANIPGFDKETVELMIPFISLKETILKDSDYVRWRNTLLTNLSIKPGNPDSLLLGTPWKVLTKYKFSAGTFSGGLTTEKDAGETFFTNKSKLPEFYSAHLAYNGSGIIRKLIIGDYSARFGQGTAINTSFRTALSLSTQGYMSARDEIKPYTSTDENNFFRGVAAEITVRNINLNLFYSRNFVDATLGSYTESSDIYIKSFYNSGIHNTNSLLQKKDVVSETSTGVNIAINLNSTKIGLVWLKSNFSLPIYPDIQKPANIFDFMGDGYNIYSLYYNSIIKKLLFYGEFSVNESLKYALVQGLTFRPSDRLTVNWLYRKYDTGFTSFHGNGPGNGVRTENEHGLLANFTFEAAKHLFISGGCDLFYFPWLRYHSSSPSEGKRQEIRLKYLPGEKLIIETSYTNRVTMTDKSVNSGIPSMILTVSNTFKASIRYRLTDNLIMTTRADYKAIDLTGSKGIMLLTDINYKFQSIPVTIWARYCIFNTSDWESRLYIYENDLLYSFSIPALSGEGNRSYIMARWKFADFGELRIKYGVTSLVDNPESLEHKKEVKLQIRAWF